MTTSKRHLELELLEERCGQTLLSTHTLIESATTLWRLRITKWDSSGRKTWTMWCERNGEFITGTEQSGRNLSQDLKEAFNL
tara:strand:- start:3781 stop:4026 length:246 start_codon:yes stop_codon:yes gene_type:complete